MKISLLVFLSVIATFTSCKERRVAPHEDIPRLQERFQGAYKIVSSTSNEAVDINKDGQASTDLLKEIDLLSNAELLLRIPANPNEKGSSFLFTQFWQQQLLVTVNTTDTISTYALQGTVRNFNFSPSLDALLIAPDGHQVDLQRFPFPDEVTIGSNDQIKVVMQKRLYTSKGWKPLTITTWYQRYN